MSRASMRQRTPGRSIIDVLLFKFPARLVEEQVCGQTSKMEAAREREKKKTEPPSNRSMKAKLGPFLLF